VPGHGHGHIEEGASIEKVYIEASKIAYGSVETFGHTNVEFSNVEMPK
jgi:hypothetical protein